MDEQPTRNRPLCVLTGGPCAGKTTLLEALAAAGFRTVREAASDVIQTSGLERGTEKFQQLVLTTQLERERTAVAEHGENPRPIFVDRGVGDHFGYLQLAGLSPFPELESAWLEAKARYRTVFFLELSPEYTPTTTRTDTPAEAERVHRYLFRAYQSRGIEPVRIDWDEPGRRMKQVLNVVNEP